MSFIRPGHVRKQKSISARKRPQWDDSVSDLDSYRATAEEVRRRKEVHKSKHHIAVKLEKLQKEKRQCGGLTAPEARSVAIMKEVLHDQQQLDSVLTKTDHMMSLVKDLFGDDAKKFTGLPNVTLPPGSQGSSRLVPKAPEIVTRTELLSESVVSQSALNDVSDENSSEDGMADHQVGADRFQSQLDMDHFLHFLRQEENHNNSAIPSSLSKAEQQHFQQVQQSVVAASSLGATNQPEMTTYRRAGTAASHPASEEASALNDTGKVKKSKPRVLSTQQAQDTSSSLNMSDLKKVFEALEAEIADFEWKTGRRPDSAVHRMETFSGYTVALVTAVTKLTHYLKEMEMRLQAEVMIREQLTQDVCQLAVTVDSLTQELVTSQEEHNKLLSEHQRCRQQMEGELSLLQAQVLDLKRYQSAHGSPSSRPSTAREVEAESHGCDPDRENVTVFPDKVMEPAAAVLLSPVVRKTRIYDRPDRDTMEQKRQTSLADLPSLMAEDRNSRSDQQQIGTYSTSSSVHNMAEAAQSTVSSSDPPHLTQLPPVMASVSVPRPVPLVQTNVHVSMPALHAADSHIQQSASAISVGGSLATATSRAPNGVANPSVMETQIIELNRQHTEAQKRLQSLLLQQRKQHAQFGSLKTEEAEYSTRPKEAGSEQGFFPISVSPPVSPISQRSEHFPSLHPVQSLTTEPQEIKVSLPVVDLEVSADSPV